jgi:hypothetical protein
MYGVINRRMTGRGTTSELAFQLDNIYATEGSKVVLDTDYRTHTPFGNLVTHRSSKFRSEV